MFCLFWFFWGGGLIDYLIKGTLQQSGHEEIKRLNGSLCVAKYHYDICTFSFDFKRFTDKDVVSPGSLKCHYQCLCKAGFRFLHNDCMGCLLMLVGPHLKLSLFGST